MLHARYDFNTQMGGVSVDQHTAQGQSIIINERRDATRFFCTTKYAVFKRSTVVLQMVKHV